MKISPDEAWLVLRKYADDAALVFGAAVITDVLNAVVLGRIVRCDDICEVRGDGMDRLTFPKHALVGAEYVDPREPLPPISDRLRTEGLESGLRLDFGARRWAFILHTKTSKP